MANTRHEWLALMVHVKPGQGEMHSALETVFGYADSLVALAPLHCIIPIPDLSALSPAVLALLPASRTIFLVPAGIMADADVASGCKALADIGYHFMVDGVQSPLHGMAIDCAQAAPPQAIGPGPQLAYRVHTAERLRQCRDAGYEWISGNHALAVSPDVEPNDGTSRKRLLALLGLVARDADSRAIELLMKQDPALSFQLLKLVNAAAYALPAPVTSFGQAINLLGRRQLQRWLQLLLYARPEQDGLANPLLSIAAVRAAQMETLCRQQGGDREQQDMAFMVGVFSLLHLLLAMPTTDIVAALNLPAEVAKALLERRGRLGAILRLVESEAPDVDTLYRGETDPRAWWASLLQAHQWAIHVNRTL